MSAGEVHHVSDATCESARAPIPFDRAVLRLRARVREVMCSARLRRTRGGRDRAGGRARPFSGLTMRGAGASRKRAPIVPSRSSGRCSGTGSSQVSNFPPRELSPLESPGSTPLGWTVNFPTE